MHRIVGVGAVPPTEGRPSVFPNAIFGLVKPNYLEPLHLIFFFVEESILSHKLCTIAL
jgi:hypothetical protein